MAAQDYTSVVQQLYVSYFGRPADFYGLKNFTEALDAMNAPTTFVELAAELETQPNGDLAQLVGNFSNSPESIALYGTDNSEIGISKFVAAIYQNFLGREADIEGFNFWVGAITSGGLDKANAVAAITAGALKNTSEQGVKDALVVTNKLAIATSFTNALDLPSEFNAYAGDAAAATARALLQGVNDTTDLNAYQANVNATVTSIVTGSTMGATYQLGVGLDNITGTAGNDVIIGSIDNGNDALNTLSALDSINGGAGVDTLKIFDGVGSEITLPGVSNVEIIEVTAVGGEGARINTSANAGVTNVNVVKSVNGAMVTAAATTDVSVAGVYSSDSFGKISVDGGKNVTVNDTVVDNSIMVAGSKGVVSIVDTNQGDGTISVDGGTDVTITATSENTDDEDEGDINVGQGGDTSAPSGNVVIVNNLNSDAAETMDGGDITVTGGKTVSITVNAASVATEIDSITGVDIGDISVTGDGKTTSVMVKQVASITNMEVAEAGGTFESNSIKFGALVAGDALTVGGLTFTANRDLTAAQVAAAFGSLTSSDTQSAGGSVANGIYTGALSGWKSAAVSGDTVVFTTTSTTKVNVTDLAAPVLTNTSGDSVAPVVTKTEGVAPTTAAGETDNEIFFGDVNVNESATGTSITSVTVDGYASAQLGATNALTKLATLSLANSDGAATLSTDVTTLALNLNNITDSVTLDGKAATITDLTLTAAGTKSTFALTAAAVKNLTVDAGVALNLTGSTIGAANAMETVTVKGAGAVTMGSVLSTGLKSFDASANTGGVTATVSANSAEVNTALKSYTFSQGADKVTLNSTTVDVAINLGAGDDSLTLKSGTTSLAKNIDGGTGTNTLVMSGADATTVSAGTDFATKIENFQKLSITQIDTNAAHVVNLSNVDNISYVISAGAKNDAGSFESAVINFGSLVSGQSIAIAGRTVTAGANDLTAAQVEAAFLSGTSKGAATVTGSLTGYTIAESGIVGDAALKFMSITAGQVADVAATMNNSKVATPTVSVTDGVAQGTTAENGVVQFRSLEAGESVTVAGRTVTNNGLMAATGIDVAAAYNGGAVADLIAENEIDAEWTVTSVVGANVTLTASTLGNVQDFLFSDTNEGASAVALISKTDGVDGVNEQASVTFTALTSGQKLAIAGVTVTATAGDLDAAQVAAVFAGIAAGQPSTATGGNFTVTGNLTGYSSAAATGSTVVFTAASVGNIDNLQPTTTNAAAPLPAGIVVTQGGVGAGAGTGTLTVNHMANGGTLEMTGAGNTSTVVMTDATGTADVFNVLAKVTTASIAFGNVVVAGVETVNVTSNDTVLDNDSDGKNDPVSTASITINADSAKTVNVAGNANTTLSWGVASTKVTMVDGSTATGKLVAETLVGGTVSIMGGAAADTLTTHGQQDVLNGGAGSDTLIVKAGANLAMLTGGAGSDIFKIDGASTNVNNAATITDLSAGDKIMFAGATAFTSTAIVLDSTAVFQDFANTAIKDLEVGEMGWFQFAGNTYIVSDVAGSDTAFQNGTDLVVKITGLVDLSMASYNATSNGLEMS